MTPSIIDEGGRSTIASAEAQAAIGVGDTRLARAKYAEAGALLEGECGRARKPEDQHLARFLAATQFYRGSHYLRSLSLAKQIRADYLPKGVASLLPGFLRDVEERASPEYESLIRSRILALWEEDDHAGIIGLLQEHPYVVEPANMAMLRAACCEWLGNYQAAAMFYSSAAQLGLDDSVVFSALSAWPLHLAGEGKLEEAWEYVQRQLEIVPNVVSKALASILSYHRARLTDESVQQELFREQLNYFDKARADYAMLPRHQGDAGIRDVMILGYEAAAMALLGMGDSEAARKMADEAIAFDESAAGPWLVRGIVSSPDPRAIVDFEKSIDLGEPSYLPYRYLAHDGMRRGDFSAALLFLKEAIKRAEEDGEAAAELKVWETTCETRIGIAPQQGKVLSDAWTESVPDAGNSGGRLLKDLEAAFTRTIRRSGSEAVFRLSRKPFPHDNEGSNDLIVFIPVEGAEVTWAGSSAQMHEFCFGCKDGRILRTDTRGKVQGGTGMDLAAGEPVNGVAFMQRSISVSTEKKVLLWTLSRRAGQAPHRAEIPVGAQSVVAGRSGYYFAPLGRAGVLWYRPDEAAELTATVNEGTGDVPDLHRLITLRADGDREPLVFAARRAGVVVTKPDTEAERLNMSAITFGGLDVVDVCPMPGASRGAIAVGINGTIILFKDVFHDKQPRTIRYESIRGPVRRILSVGKYLFLLTSEGLYVIVGLVDHFLAGSEENYFTPILVVPMQGSDANVVGDRWILIVTPGGVLRLDIELLKQLKPPGSSNGFRSHKPIPSPTPSRRLDVPQRARDVMACV